MTDEQDTQHRLENAEPKEQPTEPNPTTGMPERLYPRGQKRPLDHGVKIRAKLKRGTDTRDQDVLLIEGRGESADEAAHDFENALERAEKEEWAERLREIQPEGDDDDEV